MAYIKIEKGKNGILRARIQVSGLDVTSNKNKLFSKKIYNDTFLTEAKFRKRVDKEALLFEEEIKNRIKEEREIIHNRILTFSELASEWVKSVEFGLSKSYVIRANDSVGKFNIYLEEKGLSKQPINKITVRDIQLFLNSYLMGTYCRGKEETYVLKKPLPQEVNFRELAREGILDRCASYNLRHGQASIKLSRAKKTCERYNLVFDEYFAVKNKAKLYSPETVKGYRRVLRTIFNEAVRYDWIAKNPVSLTKISSGSNNVSIRQTEEKEVFTFTETRDILKIIEKLPDYEINKKIVLKTFLLTGLRNSEMCGLRWSDVDFVNKVIHVRRNRIFQQQYGIYEKAPKTKTSIRDIPLVPELENDLKEYMKWFIEADKDFMTKLDTYYIAATHTREPLHPHTPYHWLSKLEVANGLKRVSCHGLRHTFCSILLSKNVPIQTVSKYLGHSDSTVTLKVYSHFISDTKERVVDAINSIVSDTD